MTSSLSSLSTASFSKAASSLSKPGSSPRRSKKSPGQSWSPGIAKVTVLGSSDGARPSIFGFGITLATVDPTMTTRSSFASFRAAPSTPPPTRIGEPSCGSTPNSLVMPSDIAGVSVAAVAAVLCVLVFMGRSCRPAST